MSSRDRTPTPVLGAGGTHRGDAARRIERAAAQRVAGRVALWAAACAAWLALAGAASAQVPLKSPHGKLPPGLDCSSCHVSKNWHTLRSPLGFDHAKTGFPLTGAHLHAACAQCHLDLHFDKPNVGPNQCGSCHVDVHEGHMLEACSECHTTQSFRQVNAELIHSRTDFPLTGAHRQITCQACHTNAASGAFTPLPTACASCHMREYHSTTLPNHAAMGYSTDCAECHTTVDWHDQPAFDHARISGGFQLVGAHASLQCASCHEMPSLKPLFTATSQNDCVACHQPDYNKAHGGSGFPTTCTACHNESTWSGVQFNHASTGFPLVGAHVSLSCSACHSPSNDLAKLATGPNDCVACHLADYNKVHAGTQVPTTCAQCHTQTSWDGASADHSLLSNGFALTGAHLTAQCTACHQVPGYALIVPKPTDNNDCVACHLADYERAHAGSNKPTTCAECHNTTKWDD